MIEAVKLWNEPNNKSHWDFPTHDPEWERFAELVTLAGRAIRAEHPTLPRVLGGMSPVDPTFVQRMQRQGAMEHVDVVAVHGFPLDWNLWSIHDWPARVAEVAAVTDKPVWVTEAGVSTFGADEVQEFGLRRTAELLKHVPRVHWYSLYDLPQSWGATTRHREAEGSSYYRHFYLGLVREDGTEKPSYGQFREHAPAMGLCQWVHFDDPRLDDMARRLKDLGVTYLRTGLSWADSFRPGALDWFDRQMAALEPFDVTVTFCFTPEHEGLSPHHTSPPKEPGRFADFCAQMVRRYAR